MTGGGQSEIPAFAGMTVWGHRVGIQRWNHSRLRVTNVASARGPHAGTPGVRS